MVCVCVSDAIKSPSFSAIVVSEVLNVSDHDGVSRRGESVRDRRHRTMSHAPHDDS